MKLLHCADDFAVWRNQARRLLREGVMPHEVSWEDSRQPQLFLAEPAPAEYFPGGHDSAADRVGRSSAHGEAPIRIPASLLEDLQRAGCFRTAGRWNLLYRILWRVARGEREAMLAGDPDGSVLHKRLKAVSREAHHMHAFLRFHPCPPGGDLDYIAWHEPAHDILATASEHFAHRLGRQRWLIATPLDGVLFDGERLDYRRPCPTDWQLRAQSVRGQEDGLWQSYYSSIFNPARLNPRIMQGHMPARFWGSLPEGKLIPLLITDARAGAQKTGQARGLSGRAGKRIVSEGRS